MSYPSVKTLLQIQGITAEQAKQARAVLQSKSHDFICDASTAADSYNRACYNRPGIHLLKMYAINQILNGYGFESIGMPNGCFSSCQNPEVEIEYINFGDPYTCTLCRISGTRVPTSYRVAGWGDVLESIERRFPSLAPRDFSLPEYTTAGRALCRAIVNEKIRAK